MILMQTNNTSKLKKDRMGTIGADDDAIREEMTRMLDELPENAIVKSSKAGKKSHHNQEAHSAHNMQSALESHVAKTSESS